MNHQCRNCREVFEEPNVKLDYPATRLEPANYIESCPKCGCEQIAEVFECDECLKHFEPEHMADDMCVPCWEK